MNNEYHQSEAFNERDEYQPEFGQNSYQHGEYDGQAQMENEDEDEEGAYVQPPVTFEEMVARLNAQQAEEEAAGKHKDGATKTYQCSMCDHKTTWKHNLYRHMRIHTGERPHVCDRCGKAFRQSTHLKKHQATSSCGTAVRLKCDHCDYQTALKQNMQRHMMIHTGQKPHLCETCGKSFRQSTHLKKHQRSTACGAALSKNGPATPRIQTSSAPKVPSRNSTVKSEPVETSIPMGHGNQHAIYTPTVSSGYQSFNHLNGLPTMINSGHAGPKHDRGGHGTKRSKVPQRHVQVAPVRCSIDDTITNVLKQYAKTKRIEQPRPHTQTGIPLSEHRTNLAQRIQHTYLPSNPPAAHEYLLQSTQQRHTYKDEPVSFQRNTPDPIHTYEPEQAQENVHQLDATSQETIESLAAAILNTPQISQIPVTTTSHNQIINEAPPQPPRRSPQGAKKRPINDNQRSRVLQNKIIPLPNNAVPPRAPKMAKPLPPRAPVRVPQIAVPQALPREKIIPRRPQPKVPQISLGGRKTEGEHD